MFNGSKTSAVLVPVYRGRFRLVFLFLRIVVQFDFLDVIAGGLTFFVSSSVWSYNPFKSYVASLLQVMLQVKWKKQFEICFF